MFKIVSDSDRVVFFKRVVVVCDGGSGSLFQIRIGLTTGRNGPE